MSNLRRGILSILFYSILFYSILLVLLMMPEAAEAQEYELHVHVCYDSVEIIGGDTIRVSVRDTFIGDDAFQDALDTARASILSGLGVDTILIKSHESYFEADTFVASGDYFEIDTVLNGLYVIVKGIAPFNDGIKIEADSITMTNADSTSCRMDFLDSYLRGINAYRSNNLYISDCLMKGLSTGVYVHSSCKNVTLERITVEDCSWCGFDIDGGSEVEINSVDVKNCVIGVHLEGDRCKMNEAVICSCDSYGVKAHDFADVWAVTITKTLIHDCKYGIEAEGINMKIGLTTVFDFDPVGGFGIKHIPSSHSQCICNRTLVYYDYTATVNFYENVYFDDAFAGNNDNVAMGPYASISSCTGSAYTVYNYMPSDSTFDADDADLMVAEIYPDSVYDAFDSTHAAKMLCYYNDLDSAYKYDDNCGYDKDLDSVFSKVNTDLVLGNPMEPNLRKIKCYPNPFNCQIHIQTDSEWTIVDIEGRELKANTKNFNATWQPPEYLESGVYFIRTKLNNRTYYKKIVYLK